MDRVERIVKNTKAASSSSTTSRTSRPLPKPSSVSRVKLRRRRMPARAPSQPAPRGGSARPGGRRAEPEEVGEAGPAPPERAAPPDGEAEHRPLPGGREGAASRHRRAPKSPRQRRAERDGSAARRRAAGPQCTGSAPRGRGSAPARPPAADGKDQCSAQLTIVGLRGRSAGARSHGKIVQRIGGTRTSASTDSLRARLRA